MNKLLTIIIILFLAGIILVGGLRDDDKNLGESPRLNTTQYFAEIDENGIVLRVIVADQDFINSGVVGDPSNWIETTPDDSKRKQYAGIGFTYDRTKDRFIAPKPSDDAVYDDITGDWKKHNATTTKLEKI